jgi:hypothetical protein
VDRKKASWSSASFTLTRRGEVSVLFLSVCLSEFLGPGGFLGFAQSGVVAVGTNSKQWHEQQTKHRTDASWGGRASKEEDEKVC